MPPSIADLTARFLAQPTHEASGDVEPYDVASGFRVDPAAAWRETQVVYKLKGMTPPPMPADWSNTVLNEKPRLFVTMSEGHYPQMVSDLSVLTSGSSAAIPDNDTACGVVGQFNRGVVALASGHLPIASEQLKLAMTGLPTSSGWHFLASVYLALAEQKV